MESGLFPESREDLAALQNDYQECATDTIYGEEEDEN